MWLIRIQQSDCSVTVIGSSIDHAVEIYFLKTIDNGLYCGVLSFRFEII